MQPYIDALLAYQAGDTSASYEIHRADGYSGELYVREYFHDREFSPLDARALDECEGSILDVGAGVGRHSLELLRRGHDVTALEILPELKDILQQQGVEKIITDDVLQLTAPRFDTLLMLTNGIGIVKTMEGLEKFLKHAHAIVSPEGQILCDSTDVFVTESPLHVAHRENNIKQGIPAGQQTLTMKRGDLTAEPFQWLHIDFQTLSTHAEQAGWKAELLDSEPGGHYLCRLTKA